MIAIAHSKRNSRWWELATSPVTGTIESFLTFSFWVNSLFKWKMVKQPGCTICPASIWSIAYCHPVAIIILCKFTKLFNMFILFEYLPRGFGLNYTVPIPKCDSRSRSLTVDDFKGISISPVISNIFEMAVLDRYSDYFQTPDNQFGLKKNI